MMMDLEVEVVEVVLKAGKALVIETGLMAVRAV